VYNRAMNLDIFQVS